VAAWLLSRLLPETERDAILGDLEEEFRTRITPDRGVRAARRWYRIQALRALRMTSSPTASHELPPARLFAMGDFLHELRFAFRQLRHRPLYAGITIFTLAMGIGASGAVLSVANPVLFRPLPYPDPGRVVTIWEIENEGGTSNIGYPTIMDLKAGARTFEAVAAVGGWGPVLTGATESESLTGQSVSADFFTVLGVKPALGRDFKPEEDAAGQNGVVILGHRLWQRQFHGDPGILERTIRLGIRDYRVVGVLPASFESLLNSNAEIWRPLGYNETLPQACRTCRHLRMVVRLKPDATLEQAQGEVTAMSAEIVAAHPGDYAIRGMLAQRLHDYLVEGVRPALLLMLGASAFVLLIACANVGNLMLARTVERQPELVVRTALGAGRGRLLQQLALENAVLCLAGCAAGLLLARWGVDAVMAMNPSLPRAAAVRLDWRVVALAVTLTAGVAWVLALASGWIAVGRGDSIRPATARSVTSRSMTGGLVVAQMALAFMLLVGAGLITRSLTRVLSVDPGFQPSRLLSMVIVASGPRYQEDQQVWQMQSRLLDGVKALPGVEGAAVASQIPLSGSIDTYGVTIEGRPLPNPADAPDADRYAVSPDYLPTLGVRVIRGRGLTADDRAGSTPVVVINETLARIGWGGDDPIGGRVQMGGPDGPWRTVVGVVNDVQHIGLDHTRTPQFYAPADQWLFADNGFQLVVRTDGDPAALQSSVREAIKAVDPDLAVSGIATGNALVETSTAERRLVMRLFTVFAAIALLLAAAGTYGLLARRVAARHRELGIRAAIGANRGRIVRLVLGDGTRLALIGTVLGLAGALVLSRLISGMLFQVGARDPESLGLSALVIGGAALVASLVPAWRAARVDPIEALRSE
jgi:putative ABC transport system permease protein